MGVRELPVAQRTVPQFLPGRFLLVGSTSLHLLTLPCNVRAGDSVTASAVSAAAAGPGGGSTAAAGAGLAAQSSKSQLFEDASAEIADIDTRLHALQNFLRMAKSSAAATGSVASGSAV